MIVFTHFYHEHFGINWSKLLFCYLLLTLSAWVFFIADISQSDNIWYKAFFKITTRECSKISSHVEVYWVLIDYSSTAEHHPSNPLKFKTVLSSHT